MYTLKKNSKIENWQAFLGYLNVELKVDVTFIMTIVLPEKIKSFMLKLLDMVNNSATRRVNTYFQLL